MIIAALDENLIAQFRSCFSLDSVYHCVNELILNSLDARSTSIAIRVNLTTFRIQVVDNGKGISPSNLEKVGLRYMTNKCHSLEDLKKHLKFYGFKGEALANISKISQKVIITTREENSEETFEKIIVNDEHKVQSTKPRASCGTTVTVEGFLNNLPVRQQCVKSNELDNIKRSVENLIIIHPYVSFTLRNDLGGKLIISSVKCPDIATAFGTIHPEIEDDFACIKVKKSKIIVKGLIHNKFHENKRLQYVYVNKRFILCPKLQILLNANLKKSSKRNDKKKFPIFIVHIECPYSDLDITLEPSKTLVFFKRFHIVKRCIEKMVNAFLGEEVIDNCTQKPKKLRVASEFGVSQIGGAVKGVATKRKSEELEEISVKSVNIIEDTPVFEEPRIPSKQTKMALPIEIKKNERKEPQNAADVSLFTNYPENEQKGKDVIMDMFIMSLKAFPGGTTEHANIDDSSKLHQSVNEVAFSPNKASLGVQTTPSLMVLPKKNMVSVGVQAGGTVDLDYTLFPRKSITKFVSDYDFDFSKVDSVPVFNFKHCDTTVPFFANLDQTKKLFDFRNKNEFENFEQPSKYDFAKNYFQKGEMYQKFNKSLLSSRMQFNQVQSPYFTKKAKVNAPSPDECQKCSCHHEENKNYEDMGNTTNLISADTPWRKDNIEMTFIKKDNAKKRLNDSSVSKYFTPKKPKIFKQSHSPFSKVINPEVKKRIASYDKSKDLFAFSSSTPDEELESHLVITIDESDKENKECRYSENILAPTLTQMCDKWTEDNNPKLFHSQMPKQDVSFQIVERIDFVPKGLSPMLKGCGKVENMSPESKNRLRNALVESYDDELLLIKWQKCLDNKDPKTFFEEIYQEKSKLIESSVPSISKGAHMRHLKGFENMKFTKSMFKHLEIVGQLDCKFIVAIEKTRKLLMLFDQHAVHERVRLEELSESYKNASTKLDQQITIFVPQVDLNLLHRQKATLKLLGLTFDFFPDGLRVLEVPLCVYNKSKKGVDIVLLTETLIREIIETVKTNNGIIVSTPKVIQNIVNSEACRGAIKFGDSLSRNECVVHLKKLMECKLPFQCAHGRPTLTPIMYLNNSGTSSRAKPNLRNLRCYN